MRMSSDSPGIPPGGGVANSGSFRWLRMPWLKAPLTSPTHVLARMLASICKQSGTSEVSGVGTERRRMVMSGSWKPSKIHLDFAGTLSKGVGADGVAQFQCRNKFLPFFVLGRVDSATVVPQAGPPHIGQRNFADGRLVTPASC